MASVAMVEAVTMALAWELQNDESVIVLGEDVGINGGVFRATAGLRDRFGDDRVIDTPLAETMIAGISVGMAAQGMKLPDAGPHDLPRCPVASPYPRAYALPDGATCTFWRRNSRSGTSF
jgi:hypothetical protein